MLDSTVALAPCARPEALSMFNSSTILSVPRPSRFSAYVQSRLRPPDIELDTVRQVLATYGLEQASTLRNLPNARRNRNLIVYTSAGKKVLKLYRSDWRPSTIIFEHSILKQLARLDFPAPRLLMASNGRTFVSKAGQHYALFDFIPGVSYSSCFLLRPHRLKLTAIAGQTLAQLHQQLQGFLPDGGHHRGFQSYTEGRPQDMAWLIRRVGEMKLASRSLADPVDKELAMQLGRRSDEFLEEIGRLEEQLEAANLPRLIIHGDYGFHNLIYHEDGEATPIDFELARIEWRLSELVSCLGKLRFSRGDYDLESMGWFVKGYQRQFPIPAAEWSLLPLVWKHYRLRAAVQYWNSYFETNGPTRKLHSALDALNQADWAAENSGQILALKGS